MVLVVLVERRQALKPLVDVCDQSFFVIVDVDSGSNVHSRHQHHAFFHSALTHDGLDLRRDVDVLAMLLRVESEVLGRNFHDGSEKVEPSIRKGAELIRAFSAASTNFYRNESSTSSSQSGRFSTSRGFGPSAGPTIPSRSIRSMRCAARP